MAPISSESQRDEMHSFSLLRAKLHTQAARYTQYTRPGPSPGPCGPGPARARPRAWPGPGRLFFWIYSDFNLSGGCFPICYFFFAMLFKCYMIFNRY